MVAVVVAVGVALRLAVMLGPLGRPDSDEMIAGLMARHLNAGEGFPAYFAGQHYGGTIELAPVAVSIRLFGTSVAALRAPTVLLAVLNALLVWRIGRRIVAEGPARVAGLLAWVWPPAAVWFGGREMLFYAPTVTLGLVVVLLALRLVSAGPGGARGPEWLGWAGLGLAVGVGWWTSPNIVYFVVPAVVVLVTPPGRTRRIEWPPWRPVLVGVAAAGVGALPWLVTNIGSGLPSLHDSEGFPATGTYLTRVGWFFTDGLPAELGLREIGTLQWIGGGLGVVAYLVAVGFLLVALRRSLETGQRRPTAPVDAVAVICFPLLMAFVPFAMAQSNLRYLFFLAPFLCLLAARLVGGRRTAIGLLTVAVIVTGLGFVRLQSVSEASDSAFKVGAVGELSPAIGALDAEHIDAVYADYWVAYRLAFESAERVRAVPSAGTHRMPGYLAFVEASSDVAWVVAAGSSQLTALTAALDGLGVEWRVVDAGDFVVVLTDRPVTPHELPNEARAPAGVEMAPPPGQSY